MYLYLGIGIVFIFVIIFLLKIVGALTANNWYVNTTINSSLPNAGTYSSPKVFYKDSSWYLINGNNAGTFNGYVYNGTDWIVNLTINASLPDIGSEATPEVFYKDTSWYMIAGNNSGMWNGFVWSGTQWVSNSTIISGLKKIQTFTKCTVFYKDSSWYLISGVAGQGVWNGFALASNGTTWIANTTIIDGLSAQQYSYVTPDVFYKDASWYMVFGESAGNFYGFVLAANGTTWIVNSTIVNSLPDIGSYSNPTVFHKDSSWYLISGESGGNFKAYSYYVTPASSCTYSGSGNWNILFSDYCNITSNVQASAAVNNITISGMGIFTTTANITGFKNILFTGTAGQSTVNCFNGGCFG